LEGEGREGRKSDGERKRKGGRERGRVYLFGSDLLFGLTIPILRN
jgi:hypothetical protein